MPSPISVPSKPLPPLFFQLSWLSFPLLRGTLVSHWAQPALASAPLLVPVLATAPFSFPSLCGLSCQAQLAALDAVRAQP